eukprot:907676-Pelagomonas_calceolata.AAC.2
MESSRARSSAWACRACLLKSSVGTITAAAHSESTFSAWACKACFACLSKSCVNGTITAATLCTFSDRSTLEILDVNKVDLNCLSISCASTKAGRRTKGGARIAISQQSGGWGEECEGHMYKNQLQAGLGQGAS